MEIVRLLLANGADVNAVDRVSDGVLSKLRWRVDKISLIVIPKVCVS